MVASYSNDPAERVFRLLARSCFFYALGNPCRQSMLGIQLEGEGAIEKRLKMQERYEKCFMMSDKANSHRAILDLLQMRARCC